MQKHTHMRESELLTCSSNVRMQMVHCI